MGRRSFISISQINRIAAAARARQRREEASLLIQSSEPGPKQRPAEFSIFSFKFDKQTRIANIEFLKKVPYRTVERYVQQDHQRYPIYSSWKERRGYTAKSIKLTNQELENLRENTNELIRKFSFDIVTLLRDRTLQPSWYIIKNIEDDCYQKIDDLTRQRSRESSAFDKRIKEISAAISQNNKEISIREDALKTVKNDLSNIDQKIEKAANHKRNIFLSIITLFIYNYFGSAIRKKRLSVKRDMVQSVADELSEGITSLNEKNEQSQKEIEEATAAHQKETGRIAEEISKILSEKETKIKEVKKLPELDTEESNFIPLKEISGMAYKKIIGCYVIRNTKNKKCYVGQSKDILRRIKQHFKGTLPHNMIFAEDYFQTAEKERVDLFEFMIIPCETKDELDKKEKDLIEEYEAFTKGYNGTSGNS